MSAQTLSIERVPPHQPPPLSSTGPLTVPLPLFIVQPREGPAQFVHERVTAPLRTTYVVIVPPIPSQTLHPARSHPELSSDELKRPRRCSSAKISFKVLELRLSRYVAKLWVPGAGNTTLAPDSRTIARGFTPGAVHPLKICDAGTLGSVHQRHTDPSSRRGHIGV